MILLQGSNIGKNYGASMKFQTRSQTAQSVLSTNHSLSCPPPPPSTISQHVNGDSVTANTTNTSNTPSTNRNAVT